jgi:hypothetical protein
VKLPYLLGYMTPVFRGRAGVVACRLGRQPLALDPDALTKVEAVRFAFGGQENLEARNPYGRFLSKPTFITFQWAVVDWEPGRVLRLDGSGQSQGELTYPQLHNRTRTPKRNAGYGTVREDGLDHPRVVSRRVRAIWAGPQQAQLLLGRV